MVEFGRRILHAPGELEGSGLPQIPPKAAIRSLSSVEEAEAIVSKFEAREANWSPRSEIRLEVSDANVNLDTAINSLDASKNKLAKLIQERGKSASEAIPQELITRVLTVAGNLQERYIAKVEETLDHLLEGEISLDEVYLIRSVLADEKWYGAVPAGYAEVDHDIVSAVGECFVELGALYTSYQSPLDAILSVGTTLQSLPRLHARFSEGTGVSSAEHQRAITELCLELIDVIHQPERMPAAIADLVRHSALLSRITTHPVTGVSESIVCFSQSTLSEMSRAELASMACREFAVSSTRRDGLLVVGGAVVQFIDVNFPYSLQQRFRHLAPENQQERVIAHALLSGYVEELLHCAQTLRESELHLLAEEPEARTSELARRYFAMRGKSPVGQSPAKVIRELDEVDVLGRMVELSREAGYSLEWLHSELYDWHAEVRAPFVAWLHKEGIVSEEST